MKAALESCLRVGSYGWGDRQQSRQPRDYLDANPRDCTWRILAWRRSNSPVVIGRLSFTPDYSRERSGHVHGSHRITYDPLTLKIPHITVLTHSQWHCVHVLPVYAHVPHLHPPLSRMHHNGEEAMPPLRRQSRMLPLARKALRRWCL